jgi:hypothetical protein
MRWQVSVCRPVVTQLVTRLRCRLERVSRVLVGMPMFRVKCVRPGQESVLDLSALAVISGRLSHACPLAARGATPP